jgi:hypothetical protein
MSTSFITPGHVRAFQAVTTQLYGEVLRGGEAIAEFISVTVRIAEKCTTSRKFQDSNSQTRQHALLAAFGL